jgi:hypothetical protein
MHTRILIPTHGLPKFTSAKIVGFPLYVATGSIAILRASPSGCHVEAD